MVDMVYEEMEAIFNVEVGVIHSNKAQNFRFNAVNHFQNGIYRILVATDLIARGIDVTDVTHVINFDIPDNSENYIHRIGRTGRYDKSGSAISFIAPKDQVAVENIEALMGRTIPVSALPEAVEYSDVVLEFERTQVAMKNVLVKLPKRENVGPAFHEKKAKNKKVNVRYDHKKAMQEKYGKPKKKGNKKK